jgi:hypothetical protein
MSPDQIIIALSILYFLTVTPLAILVLDYLKFRKRYSTHRILYLHGKSLLMERLRLHSEMFKDVLSSRQELRRENVKFWEMYRDQQDQIEQLKKENLALLEIIKGNKEITKISIESITQQLNKIHANAGN